MWLLCAPQIHRRFGNGAWNLFLFRRLLVAQILVHVKEGPDFGVLHEFLIEDQLLDEVVQPLTTGADEIWAEVVPKQLLARQLEMRARALLLDNVEKFAEVIVPPQHEPGMAIHSHHHLVDRELLVFLVHLGIGDRRRSERRRGGAIVVHPQQLGYRQGFRHLESREGSCSSADAVTAAVAGSTGRFA
uniref:Putative secreted protein n=1 Tax=Ixodes ricinus TaxID=34613 RepID=A0A6B0UZV5_IXORI